MSLLITLWNNPGISIHIFQSRLWSTIKKLLRRTKKISLDAWPGALNVQQLKESLAEPSANGPLGLAAGRQPDVALPVDVDGQAERVTFDSTRSEPEFIWKGSRVLPLNRCVFEVIRLLSGTYVSTMKTQHNAEYVFVKVTKHNWRSKCNKWKWLNLR